MRSGQISILIRMTIVFVVLFVSIFSAIADERHDEEGMATSETAEVDMTKSINKVSYAMGYKIGDMFQNLKMTIIPDAVIKGMYDARKNIRPALTKAEMKMILRDPKKFMIEDIDSVAQKNKQQEDLFLRANAQREGVEVRESGLQYSVLQPGDGKKPKMTDTVKVMYKGRTLKGYVFDNTYDKSAPKELPVNSVLPGMSEALQLMQEGAKWEIYIPSALAYANQGPMAGQALVFEVELMEVLPKE